MFSFYGTFLYVALGPRVFRQRIRDPLRIQIRSSPVVEYMFLQEPETNSRI